jgi:hypothetical protein
MESVEYEADFEIQSRARFFGNVLAGIDRMYGDNAVVDDAGHDGTWHVENI